MNTYFNVNLTALAKQLMVEIEAENNGCYTIECSSCGAVLDSEDDIIPCDHCKESKCNYCNRGEGYGCGTCQVTVDGMAYYSG